MNAETRRNVAVGVTDLLDHRARDCGLVLDDLVLGRGGTDTNRTRNQLDRLRSCLVNLNERLLQAVLEVGVDLLELFAS